MINRDELFQKGGEAKIWQKYCGFLDLSLGEFMEIQEQLLSEELELVAATPLGARIIGASHPPSVAEFRQVVPLTTYEDYASDLSEKREEVLAERPHCWVYTTGPGGSFKWIPYTARGYQELIDNAMSLFVLSSTTNKGEVNVRERDRVLYNTAPRPYLSGYIAAGVAQRFNFRPVPPIELSEAMDFEQRIENGFEIALHTGVDILGSITSILVKIGEGFTERSGGMKLSASMLRPQVLFRLARGLLRSKIEGRGLLPRDLWPVKGIFCCGTDTAIYKDQVAYYWGRKPYEFYARSEAGIAAMQSWNNRGELIFVPTSVFLEFIPEEEWLKSRRDGNHQPATVLLDEVEVGHRYELVITSFYGMPFLRYRVGDLVKIVSLGDEEAGVELPQMVYEGRTDEVLDIAGFTRLDERTVWQAIVDSGVRHQDWTIRKEYDGGQPILRLYLEMKNGVDSDQAERLVHNSLKASDPSYDDLEHMLGVRPLRVTLLAEGSFERYSRERQTDGLDLASSKPPHMNAPDDVIQNLLRLSTRG